MLYWIACVDKNNAIGYQNRLLFNFNEDMKFFRATTMGQVVLMGSKTLYSIGRALPNRENLILTKSPSGFPDEMVTDDVTIYNSLDAALDHPVGDKKLFCIGGASVYEQTYDIVDKAYITEVDVVAPNADAYLPKIQSNPFFRRRVMRSIIDRTTNIKLDFVEYTRIKHLNND